MAVKEAKLCFIFKSPKAQGSRRKKERTEKRGDRRIHQVEFPNSRTTKKARGPNSAKKKRKIFLQEYSSGNTFLPIH